MNWFDLSCWVKKLDQRQAYAPSETTGIL